MIGGLIRKMKSWIYETHLHTSPASACSDTRGRDYIAPYMDAGYAGVIVTVPPYTFDEDAHTLAVVDKIENGGA